MPTLVLTLQLDPDCQAFFERLRQLHFPAERNLVPAHLTLFHQLPHNDTVMVTLKQVADKQLRFPIRVLGARSLGRGVAYAFSSDALMSLRDQLAQAFDSALIAQDRQRFDPHVVIQNKVSPEQARALLEQQRGAAAPTWVEACGLDLWQYLGGPWEHLETYSFRGAELALRLNHPI